MMFFFFSIASIFCLDESDKEGHDKECDECWSHPWRCIDLLPFINDVDLVAQAKAVVALIVDLVGSVFGDGPVDPSVLIGSAWLAGQM